MSFCAEIFPIRTVDFTSPADAARHDRMVGPGGAHCRRRGPAQKARVQGGAARRDRTRRHAKAEITDRPAEGGTRSECE